MMERENASIVRLQNVLGPMKERGVARAWAFGSRAVGKETADSDWDILVEFKADQPPTFDRYMGLKMFLEERLGGRVDLLSKTACKPRFLEAIRNELVELHGS